MRLARYFDKKHPSAVANTEREIAETLLAVKIADQNSILGGSRPIYYYHSSCSRMLNERHMDQQATTRQYGDTGVYGK
jgi:hypothetical protein